MKPLRWVTRVSCFASAGVVLAAFLTPLPVVAQDGYVFSVRGDWRVSSRPAEPVANGMAISSQDTIRAGEVSAGGSGVVFWFEQGRVRCRARVDGTTECSDGDEAPCASSSDAVLVLLPCLDGNPTRVVRLMSAMMRAFGEDPSRYWPLLTRSDGDELPDAILPLNRGTLRLDGSLVSLPAGTYRYCLTPIGPGNPVSRECGDFGWDGEELGLATSQEPGLVELEITSMWTRTSAWVLLTRVEHFHETLTRFAEAERLIATWSESDHDEIRAARRAMLQHLASDAGPTR